MRMDRKIWQALPEELLLLILGRLPVRFCVKLRTVCKRWNYVLCCRDTLQRTLDAKLSKPMRPVNPIAGFFVQTYKFGLETWAIEDGGSQVYKVALRSQYDRVNNRYVLGACNGLIFCRSNVYGDEDIVSSIENPASRTSMRLPSSPHLRRHLIEPDLWMFHAMAVDVSTRRATVVVGRNNFTLIGQDCMNRIEMEIFDTDSNAWSCFSMTVPSHIIPNSRGIYSGGKFYWLVGEVDTNAPGCIYSAGKFHWPYGDIYPWTPSTGKCMIAFSVADRLWEEIPLPKEGTWHTSGEEGCEYARSTGCEYARLSGCDGRVVLTCQKCHYDLCLWKLNENSTWYELLGANRSVTGFCDRESLGLFGPVFAAVNRSGWIMLMDGDLKAIIFNDEGKLVRCLSLPRSPELEPVLDTQLEHILVLPFEANTMWWPK